MSGSTGSRSVKYQDYLYVLEILASGDEAQLAELEQLLDNFPQGVDAVMGYPWIYHALEQGGRSTLVWMLNRQVDLSVQTHDGYTVLHVALEREKPDKYEVLELLLQHGAPINARGVNDWTPAHRAAVQEDMAALELLVRYGADLSVRTRIDAYATPLEEAQLLHKLQAVRFLQNLA